MPETKILIVVTDHDAGEAYAEAVSHAGACCDVASSFEEMSALAMDNSYNGLLMDILTLVRCSKEEKVIAYEVINLYPVMRVKWDVKKKKINLSPLEQSFSPDTESALKVFIDSRCRRFPGRRLRRHHRKSYHLNLLLSADGSFSETTTLKTFTLNVSRTGLFVHVTQAVPPGTTVWLRFVEFPELAPVEATVRWGVAWGASRSIPGMGLMFGALSTEQEQAILAITDR